MNFLSLGLLEQRFTFHADSSVREFRFAAYLERTQGGTSEYAQGERSEICGRSPGEFEGAVEPPQE